MPASRLQLAALAFVLLMTLVLSLRNYDSFQLGTYVDDADYAILAHSIAFGDVYGLIHYPGPTQATRFPVGFPLVLAPLARFFPAEPELMRYVSLSATLLNAVLLFAGWPYLSNGSSRWWGVVVAALYGWFPLMVGQTRMVMSEPTFTTFALTTLILTERFARSQAPRRSTALLLGALAAFAVLVRTLGVVLGVAIVVRMVAAKPIGSAVRSLGIMLAGALLLVMCMLATTPIRLRDFLPRQYAVEFAHPPWEITRPNRSSVPRAVTGARYYALHGIRAMVLPFGGGQHEAVLARRIGLPVFPALIALTVLGLVMLGASLPDGGVSLTVGVFEGMYIAALLFWPGHDARLFYPIQPLLSWHFLGGISCGARLLCSACRVPLPGTRMLTAGTTAAAIALLTGTSLYKGLREQDDPSRHVRDITAGMAWLRTETSIDAVVMTSQPRIAYLYSGRKAVDRPLREANEHLESALARDGVDYLMLEPRLGWRADGPLDFGPSAQQFFIPVVDRLVARGILSVAFESPKDRLRIYKVNHGALP